MGGGNRRKVDRCNRVKKIPGMEDPQQVASDQTSHGIAKNRESGDPTSFGCELIYFFIDL